MVIEVEGDGAAMMSPTPSSDSVTSGANHREELGRRRPDRHEGCAGDVLGHLFASIVSAEVVADDGDADEEVEPVPGKDASQADDGHRVEKDVEPCCRSWRWW